MATNSTGTVRKRLSRLHFFKGTDTEAQIRNLEENRRRADLLPTELARGVELIRKKGGTYENAADVIGKSKKNILDLHEWFKNSTAELKKATDEGLISMEKSKDLAECAPSEQRTVVDQVREIIANTSSKKEANGQVRSVIDRATGNTDETIAGCCVHPSIQVSLSDAPRKPRPNGTTEERATESRAEALEARTACVRSSRNLRRGSMTATSVLMMNPSRIWIGKASLRSWPVTKARKKRCCLSLATLTI